MKAGTPTTLVVYPTPKYNFLFIGYQSGLIHKHVFGFIKERVRINRKSS